MPDRRQHRGPHPQDARDFAPGAWLSLRSAVEDLAWLLGRGYALPSALKLTGDRYQLTERQRTAVMRSTCSDAGRERRQRHRVELAAVAGQPLVLDGYNLLTTVEAALAGGLILRGRDGCYRDLAARHGTWHRVEETMPAADLLGDFLNSLGVAGSRWLLDRPVSNSGRLATLLRERAAARGWAWEVELVWDPDAVLKKSPEAIATSDSVILDRALRWCNLARAVVDALVPTAWVVDLAVPAADSAIVEDSNRQRSNHPAAHTEAPASTSETVFEETEDRTI